MLENNLKINIIVKILSIKSDKIIDFFGHFLKAIIYLRTVILKNFHLFLCFYMLTRLNVTNVQQLVKFICQQIFLLYQLFIGFLFCQG